MKQLPLAIGFAAEPDFETFVAGSNAAVVESLRTLHWPAPPVYLWGPDGSGKTHLLRALAARVAAAGGRCEGFDAACALPWTADDATALLLLDDVDRYDAGQQQAAFALFVHAAAHGAQVAAAGQLPPVDLPLREDLRTRLGSGLVHALQPLSDDEIRLALAGEAQRRGIALPAEVLDHLLTRHARDLGFLMALLAELDRYALSQGRAITVPLLRQMLVDGGVPA
jgi:DnaA family protein